MPGGPLPEPTDLAEPPGPRIAELVDHLGTDEVVRRCVELLTGASPGRDPTFLRYLGGHHALRVLAGRDGDYWPRVWAARALRYAWAPPAIPAVVAALADPAWRVQEWGARLIAQHEVAEGADPVTGLTTAGTPRVRAAAARAVGEVGEHEHVDAVIDLLDDPDALVRRAAGRALRRLQARLDLDLGGVGRRR